MTEEATSHNIIINNIEKKDDPTVDPFCDPNNPKKVEFSEISTAAFNLKDGIMKTPCYRSNQLSDLLEMHLYFKKEFLQVTGSFKERGARYAMLKLSEEQKKSGVVAASAGNHALALSYHGQLLNIPVTVVMPIFAPLMKVYRCKSYGANVILHGQTLQECKILGLKMSKEKNMTYINGYDHPDVIAGQGSIGLEILEDNKNLDAVIVPVGGGGLIAGVGLAIKSLRPQVQIIGVESEDCSSFKNEFENERHELRPEISLADGLAVPIVGTNALQTSKGIIDKLVTVPESTIALAVLRLLEMEKSVIEGAGAVGLAGLLTGKLDFLKGKKVCVILTGGNIDTTVLGRTIERGLAVDSRLIKFDVVVSDRPGGISELTSRIAKLGASIKDIFHERAWLSQTVFSVRVRIICETRDKDHVSEIQQTLSKYYSQQEIIAMEYKIKVTNKFHFCSDDEDVADPSELIARALANKKKKMEEAALKKKADEQKAKEAPAVVAKPVERKPARENEKRGNSSRGRGGFRGDRRPKEEGRPKRTEEKVQGTTEEGGDDDFEINRRPPRNSAKKSVRKSDNERKPRASGSTKTGVRSIPKRDGFGKGNWGTQNDELTGETEPINQAPADENENVAPETKTDAVEVANVQEEEKTLTLEEYKAQIAAAKKDETPFNIRQISEQEFKKLNLIPINKKKVEQTNEEVEIIRREPRKQIIALDLKFVDPNKKNRRDNNKDATRGRGNNNRRSKPAQGFVYKDNAFPALGSA
uniref:L-serine deaminase n=1 Tax=Parastrongyloides trichosuri TaxID=131310 RepID=A0A0N4Z9M4_PARTI